MAPPNLNSTDTEKGYDLLPSEDHDENSQIPNPTPAEDQTESNENDKLVENTQIEGGKSESKSDDLSTDDMEVVVPPDGGWGWVIVFASFMCNLIVDGIIFSFGTFLPDIAEDFHVSKAHVTLVGSLMSGFYLIAGPFASAIANRYGFRLVALIGTVLGTAAFVLSYFARSVEFLCITYGLLGGIGFGFIYVPSVITVGFYFERWRALATGIAVCGSGIGTFVFAPLSEALITSFGWRNALLIQSVIVLSCLFYGALFRPLKPTKLKDLDEEASTEQQLVMDPAKLPTATKLKMEEAMKHLNKHDHKSSFSKLFMVNNNEHERLYDVYHTIHVPSRSMTESLKEKRLSVPFIVHSDKLKSLKPTKITIIPKKSEVALSHGEEINRPIYRDDIFFGQSLTRLPQYTSQTSVQYNLSVTRVPTKNDILEEKTHSCKLCPEAVKRALGTMLDFSLLKSPSFLILAVGGFFTMMGFYVPFMYLVDRASGSMPKQTAVLLVSSIGIANTIGRVLCGLLSSFPGVNALFVTNAALTLGGIATIFSGISLSQEYQFFYTVVFGLAISCFASLRSIIVVDLLGLERLTNAFGLLLLFQGVAAIIGAPLAGAFMDYTGSYDASFYLSGSMILISAIMCYPLNWVNKWEQRRNNQRTELENDTPKV
ncbi:monocarboxylate transporter 5-like [Rhynchophorus ferrugineus]|uniref:monocarboxylate transporter 5-like n=1 Tax=Rhynchophorus ferrugineus TaxID=354439 RepID=UPI003FCD9F08